MEGCTVFIEMACRRPQEDRRAAQRKKSRSQATHGKCFRRRRNFYWPCGGTNQRRMSYGDVTHLFLRSATKRRVPAVGFPDFLFFFLRHGVEARRAP